MRRRDFIRGIVGSAGAWPFVARAQQGEHMRRIGVLLPASADDATAFCGAKSLPICPFSCRPSLIS